MTAVEYLYKFLYEMESVEGFDPYSFNQKDVFNKAKQMEKQEKLKVQIAENESVLEMLRLHGNDSSIMRVFSRLESLKEQLKEL